jgi:hypothetical protein
MAGFWICAVTVDLQADDESWLKDATFSKWNAVIVSVCTACLLVTLSWVLWRTCAGARRKGKHWCGQPLVGMLDL